MEITKVVKPFIRRGANTFGDIVYMRTPQYALVTGLLSDFNPFSYFSHSMSLKLTAFLTFHELPLTIIKVNSNY